MSREVVDYGMLSSGQAVPLGESNTVPTDPAATTCSVWPPLLQPRMLRAPRYPCGRRLCCMRVGDARMP